MPNKKKETKDPWSLEVTLQKMERDKRKDLQILALWIRKRGLTPQTSGQLSAIIKRHVRSVKGLKEYELEDIEKTITHLEGLDYLDRFTLDTVAKFIDDEMAEECKVLKKDPRISSLIKYFSDKCNERWSFYPDIRLERDEPIVKAKLLRYTEADLKNELRWYLITFLEDNEKFGHCIKTALSPWVFNKWLKDKANIQW